MVTVEIGIYSPRWGHDDTYRFAISRENLTVTAGAGRNAVCRWQENLDPEWDGANLGHDNPLIAAMENDQIYPPTVFIFALEAAWQAWRDNRLDDQQVEQELTLLCEWVNATTRAEPRSDYWSTVF